jgi:hypothetical protein
MSRVATIRDAKASDPATKPGGPWSGVAESRDSRPLGGRLPSVRPAGSRLLLRSRGGCAGPAGFGYGARGWYWRFARNRGHAARSSATRAQERRGNRERALVHVCGSPWNVLQRRDRARRGRRTHNRAKSGCGRHRRQAVRLAHRRHPRPLRRGLRVGPREVRARCEVLHVVVHILARRQRHPGVFHLATDRREQPADGQPGPERQAPASMATRRSLAGRDHRYHPPWLPQRPTTCRGRCPWIPFRPLEPPARRLAAGGPTRPRRYQSACAGVPSHAKNRPFHPVKPNDSAGSAEMHDRSDCDGRTSLHLSIRRNIQQNKEMRFSTVGRPRAPRPLWRDL